MHYLTLFTQFFASADGGANCDPNANAGNFLLFPHWYEYLNGYKDANTGGCIPQFQQLSDIWLVLAAIIEILLRIAALGAIAFVVYGGFQLITSRGDPNATKAARSTITNALVGLLIAVAAATVITFIAGQFK